MIDAAVCEWGAQDLIIENKRLKAALRLVEDTDDWGQDIGEDGRWRKITACHICGRIKPKINGHAPDCPIGLALA
jgi:hypothetical protein